MTTQKLEDAIDYVMARVVSQVAAALVAGNDAEAGRIIRTEAERQIADWRELDAPSLVSDAELAAAFRDVWGAEIAAKRRDDANEVWAKVTADVRAHEAGE